jgi:predicted RNA-binding Zn ribbon-like protein
MRTQRDPADAAAPPSRAGVLPLIGGALCLDFANTSSGRGTARHRENLASCDLLLVWCAHAGLIGSRERNALARIAAVNPKKAANLLRRARALREAIHAIVAAIARKETPPARALALLNGELSRVMGRARLSHRGDRFALEHDIATDSLEGLLPPIVRSAAELLLNAAPERLKQCPGQHCGWVFLDRTRNGRRRWCEMEVCGARAKLRRFRARRRRTRA